MDGVDEHRTRVLFGPVPRVRRTWGQAGGGHPARQEAPTALVRHRPGPGIPLQSGPLVVPCDCRDSRDQKQHSLVLDSDDRGPTWQLGGVTEAVRGEREVVEPIDRSLLLLLPAPIPGRQ